MRAGMMDLITGLSIKVCVRSPKIGGFEASIDGEEGTMTGVVGEVNGSNVVVLNGKTAA